jgi:hypothetical protein
MRRALIIGVVLTAAACGASPNPAPTIISEVSGNWTGALSPTSATGGPECLSAFQQSIGLHDQLSLAITQTGSTLSGTGSSQAIGQTCTYYGTAGNGMIALSGNVCQPGGATITCNGALRDAFLVRRLLTATVSGAVMTGTASESWSIFPTGTTIAGLGVIEVTSGFTLSR